MNPGNILQSSGVVPYSIPMAVLKEVCVANARNLPDYMCQRILYTWIYMIHNCRDSCGMVNVAGAYSPPFFLSGESAGCFSSITILRIQRSFFPGNDARAAGRI